ncbi:putative iron/ascorbate oxidoreductase [Mollisia scopiformis]|uniref:Putative iron/ascorbate oxidoreductase n=1 Tax=Mollisia scopiformis TaxID=149040 RepID=A0A194X9L9_MOLSC|nr:putative iron/ascorbate oxidoreductase [Mollisia scopiformis]KUJ16875.1 putative iron/ascorbate oxidoreductase [Mollisia scopiformis]
MSTSFSSLPVVSLSALSSPSPDPGELTALSTRLDEAFSTTGFVYLKDLPLTFSHEDVFALCDEFFGANGLSMEEKMTLAKKTFIKTNKNTYRGYFPTQAGADNVKEGFELGTPSIKTTVLPLTSSKFDLTEPNVFHPSYADFQARCEMLHTELQSLAARLLSLLAISLGKPATFFDHYLFESLSTLRLLHYPPVPAERQQELICTPHTDSGILTLLHQDSTGGLEVQNTEGDWISAPYVPGSIVVNIGDLMAKVSGGRWVATFHRVRSARRESGEAKGRYSVPFFFEPGLKCLVKSVEGDEVVYGVHVLDKMKGWVEFQDVAEEVADIVGDGRMEVEAF